MSILKFCFAFAALVMVLAPAYASEENVLHIENITSISSIVNPATLDLARSVNAVPEWRNFIPPQAFWSPDGSKIAFISLEKGVKLYTVNPDGTGKKLLTSNLSWSGTNPYVWSPSGDKIAFSSSTANCKHIFIENPDGTERVQITTGENKHYVLSGMGGSWSPDGSRLLIESQNDQTSRNEVLIAKLSGYDRTMPVRAPENINRGEVAMSQQTLNATPEPAAIADAPKTPGFSMLFAGTMLIVSMFLMKRRNA